MKYKIVIDGKPVGKERPRFSPRGYAYTPRRTKEYEQEVALLTKGVVPNPLAGPVRVRIDIYVSTKKFPDLDNAAKSILDALNHVAYEDDRQIEELQIRRIHSTKDKAVVQIETIDSARDNNNVPRRTKQQSLDPS